jgi:hypothetical protein
LTGVLSFALWLLAKRLPGYRIRFTLRSLFIATTLLAVVLGMSVWLDRAWIGW